jgi:predicted ABC-type ATPase
MPNAVLLAGPDGAGKTTAAPRLLKGELQVSRFVNADAIAQGLSAYSAEAVSIQAGRLMLRRLKEVAAQGADFAFETTLASRGFAPWIRDLTSGGYVFRLLFLWLPSPERCVQRVVDRACQGGDFVPAETVRRRYGSGLRNFFSLYRPLADSWRFYDSTAEPRLAAEGSAGGVTVHDSALWLTLESKYSHGRQA